MMDYWYDVVCVELLYEILYVGFDDCFGLCDCGLM